MVRFANPWVYRDTSNLLEKFALGTLYMWILYVDGKIVFTQASHT